MWCSVYPLIHIVFQVQKSVADTLQEQHANTAGDFFCQLGNTGTSAAQHVGNESVIYMQQDACPGYTRLNTNR